MAGRLSDVEIQTKLAELTDWQREGDSIQTICVFKDFVSAIAFVNALVTPAEAAGHHPDIAISYNRVTISLTTHDAGGLTEQDFAMAKTIAALA